MEVLKSLEVPLFLSLCVLLIVVAYRMLLKHWDNRVINQVIVENLEDPYDVRGAQTFKFAVDNPTAIILNILKEDESIISKLLDQECQPGSHEVNYDCSNLPSGWYWYQIKTPNQNIIRKFRVR